jgi:type II secretory pathway pseudopilin PulG
LALWNQHLTMKTVVRRRDGLGSGFTLLETLVVVSIIMVLAAILLPTFGAAKKQVKVKLARLEMSTIVAAINQYQSVYSLPPISRTAIAASTHGSPDFTCGTVLPDGSTVSSTKVVSTGNAGYQNCNSEVMAILADNDFYPNTNHVRNPQRHSFLSAKSAAKANGPGLGSDCLFRDPWGNPYIVTVDVNLDGTCQDGFYYPLTKPGTPVLVKGPAMVWSFGPDGKAELDAKTGPKGGANRDNVLSWD